MANAAKVLRGLDLVIARALPVMAAAAYQELEIEMTEMKARTPVDTGVLRNSGFVDAPRLSSREAEIKLGFGGPSIGYAVPVHENTESFHNVGQAKYMESVLVESEPHLAGRIARRADLAEMVR